MGRIAVALVVVSWVIPISILVNRIVPDPYMDEIFHVPQAQQYCKGNFRSWDPMITTPPGLYFVSLAHVASLFPGIAMANSTSSFPKACSTSVLRSTNGVLAVICGILVYDIIRHLRPTLSDRKATLYALVLTLYPLHWFFTFLYYTDVASLTAVLATYLTSLKRKYWISALFGAVAVLIRQTNIIWVLFIVCSGVIKLTLSQKKDDLQPQSHGLSAISEGHSGSRIGMTSASNLRKRKSGVHDSPNHLIAPSTVFPVPDSAGLHKEVLDLIFKSWELKWKLLSSFIPFLFVLSAFVAFVLWNGSIVLGAKDAHKVSPHIAQLLYCGFVSAMFMAPVHFSLSQATALARSLWKKKLLSFFYWVIAVTFGFLSVHFFRRKFVSIPKPPEQMKKTDCAAMQILRFIGGMEY
ncbi:OLC1v1034833C1 [Oldenlandia corymbosa var. corymbosa]|uniref:Dol-P-Glc:Glc(2)Man(9)GlcNAc(2)-PP-Dol alpha-1,2-glucosyltransferase n=1 Tax=Oldenlandia corymbosa var. corymbosa TaxID=529605 RepID=A0AAV1CSV9_OLDCO|nr:OLC1v1034833C1 [Oldenlandia corymbosa var. corymbosa]